jgi:hypothetical protein
MKYQKSDWVESGRSAEERVRQRDHDAGCDLGGLGVAVDSDDALEVVWKLAGQCPEVGTVNVIPIADGQIDLLDTNFQHIAGHCSLDEDRAGQDVEAGPAILHVPKNGSSVVRNDAGCDYARFVDIGWINLGRGPCTHLAARAHT